ncbi:hypothetical protein G3O08_00295 [Cryomorpha ignava]|uniref:Uncharacterized protein n=1 Tax=Cryomorpha ignava TaxID=101383 RepID=A0A7K3WM25_9FLAO|nr:hypothetical protein [Cryomorpha ignava]NEN21942.1 hypothetical protein [Cryomorpha ignava]
MASLQAKSQTQLHLSNKSDCDFAVEIVLCNTSTVSSACAPNDVYTVYLVDNIDYFKVFFVPILNFSTPDVEISPGINCNTYYQSGTSPCGGYQAGPSTGIPQQYNFAAY